MSAAITGAVAAASTAATITTGAIANYNAIGDAYTATVINLSRRSWTQKMGTGEPVQGEWMVPPSNLTSFHDIVQQNPVASPDQIKEMVRSLGPDRGMGFQPWMTCTLAHAGGGCGPALVICLEDKTDNLTLTLMMLIRPGYNYCAGANLSRGWIGTRADGNGWEIYRHIEDREELFSDGVRKVVEWSGVRVTFQPAKEMKFTIEDV